MNMKKLAKKWIALTMAGALVLSAPVMAMAEDSGSKEANSTGSSTGHMDSEIVNVTLPTAAEKQFDFVADPERLIDKATSGDEANFNDGTNRIVTANSEGMYFYVKSGDAANSYAFASTSEPIRIINNSAIDVDMTFKAEVLTAGDFKVSTEPSIKNSTGDATLYLAIGSRTNTASPFNYDDGALKEFKVGKTIEVPVTLTGGDDNYKAVLSGSEYAYEIKPGIATDDTTAWKYAEFNMRGACSQSTVTKDTKAPELQVTWSFAKHDDVPTLSFTTDGKIEMKGFTADIQYTSLSLKYEGTDYNLGSNSNVTWNTSGWSAASGGDLICQLNSAWLALLPGKDIDVTMTYNENGSAKTKTVTTTFASN